MLIAGLVAAALAAAIHVVIFAWESLLWMRPSTRPLFGVRSEADAQTMKQLALNQGFYNLFLAVITVLGIVLVAAGERTVGLTLVLAGTGMMLAAALVLLLSDRRMARAAALQGGMPLIAVVATVLALVTT